MSLLDADQFACTVLTAEDNPTEANGATSHA